MGNMQAMMRKVQKMQADIAKMQEDMKKRTFETSVGGGAITVVVSGKKELQSIKIKPEAVDLEDIEMLEDLIVAATNEAFHQMEAESSAVMSELTGGLGNLGGLSF